MEAVCKLGFLKRTGYIAGADVVLEDVGFYVDNLQQGHLDDTVVALKEGRIFDWTKVLKCISMVLGGQANGMLADKKGKSLII